MASYTIPSQEKFNENLTGSVTRTTAQKLADTVSVKDFGAKGDGVTDDTAAIQAALNAANSAVDITTYQNLTPGNGNMTEVYFPTGLYKVTSTITVPGIVSLRGDGNELTYGGSRIRQFTSGAHLFQVAGTSATVNASVQFRDLALSSASSTHAVGTALIYIPSTVTNAASIYIKGCWFQTPEYWAIRVDKGDDLTIMDNTFDVTSQRAISLGSATTLATSVLIRGNYFFWVQTGIVAVINVSGLQFVGNRIAGNSVNRTGYVVDALNQSPVLGDAIIVDHNVTFYANGLLLTKFNGANVTGNVVRLATGPVVQVGGGGTVGNMLISSNNISGVFTGTSAIDGSGASLTYAALIGNTFGGTDGVGGPGGTAFLMTGASTANNNFQGNVAFGFTTVFNVAGGPNNVETNSTGSGTSPGFTGTGGSGGAAGVVGNGTLGGAGVSGTGGATAGAHGVDGFGGSGGGRGVVGTGTSGWEGVVGTGQGASTGVLGVGGATGVGVTGTGGATSGAGVSGTGTAGNSAGGSFTGQGSAAGVSSQGGATGSGGTFVGGATSGIGVIGTATAGNSIGGSFTGQGSGAGVSGTGGASGVGITATGGGAAAGVSGTGGATAGSHGVDGIGGSGGGRGVVGTGTNGWEGVVGNGNLTAAGGAFVGTTTGPAVQSYGAIIPTRVVLTYSGTIATNAALADIFSITATNGTAFTISNPTNPLTGQRLTYVIRNTSGGAHGAITWGAAFKTAAAALTVTTAFSKTIEFVYDGVNWIEVFRSAADVAN